MTYYRLKNGFTRPKYFNDQINQIIENGLKNNTGFVILFINSKDLSSEWLVLKL